MGSIVTEQSNLCTTGSGAEKAVVGSGAIVVDNVLHEIIDRSTTDLAMGAGPCGSSAGKPSGAARLRDLRGVHRGEGRGEKRVLTERRLAMWLKRDEQQIGCNTLCFK